MTRTPLAVLVGAALAVPALAQDEQPNGGSMTVSYKDDVSTLDPAIGYDWQNWSMIKSLFDGLMDYEPGTTTLVNDLAEDYAISDDGLTYTFTLRDGVTFHNGREMTAEDVKYSLDRVTNPETQSPGAGFLRLDRGLRRGRLRRGRRALGREGRSTIATVEITLSRPDATFLHVMAINFSSVVPKEVVEEQGDGLRAATPSAPVPSLSPSGRSARRLVFASATTTTGRKGCRISTGSRSRSGRSRSWRCCACSRARSTYRATGFRRRSSSRCPRTPSSRTTSSRAASCRPATSR